MSAIVWLSLFAVPATAAGFSDVAGLPCETAVNFLAGEGIVNGRSEGLYAPGEGLTRAEMVAIILRAYGEAESEILEKFSDVPKTHWAFRYVEIAYGMGIINGMTETTFVPDGAVTKEQAVKMLVAAMGRGEKAEEAGGYPDGYMAVAADAGVLEGVEGENDQPISRGTMAQLVYNCLKNANSYMIDWDGVADHYNWIRDEKIRALYGAAEIIGEEPGGVVERVQEAGCNTLFLNLISSDKDYTTPEGTQDILNYISENMSKYDMRVFVKINFGDNGYTRNNAFGTYHPGIYKASYTNTPDPLSEEYWERQIVERALMIAAQPAFTGIILDFEMYSGGASSYSSNCMCDNCWKKFRTAKGYTGEWEEVEAADRSQYLAEKAKTPEYDAWYLNEMVRLFTNVREKVHAVNPNVIFGYMPAFEWVEGMTRGLGTPEKPVIVLSEQEYWGSLADTQPRMQLIRDEEYPALYLPGLFPGTGALSPQQLEEKIKLCAPTTAGFWMYAAQTIRVNEENYPALKRGIESLEADISSGKLTPLPTYEVRSYSAKKIAGAEPTEAEWEAAVSTEPFVHYQFGEEGTVPVETQAKILYSDSEIFVRCEAFEENMESFAIGDPLAHDGNLWAGDCLEIFWKFDGVSSAVHLAADPAGSIYDAFSTGIGSENSDVNFDGISASTKKYDDRWEITVRIPGTMDGNRTIQKGDTLRMEIGRYRPKSRETGDTTNSCWAPTYGSYLGSSSLWGYVTLD